MRFSVKRSEDHTSEIEQTFVSTKDCAKPISCTTSKFRSVTIREVFFGQAIHKAPLGLSDLVSMVILFLVQNYVLQKTIISKPPRNVVEKSI